MMKKLILSLILLATAFACFAQDGLKGSWTAKHSMMGISVVETDTYLDNTSGTVISKATISIDMSIMIVAKIKGSAEGYMEGSFTYDGSKIVIKWNKDSLKFKWTKPLTATVKGEQNDDLDKLFKETFGDFEKEMMESAEKEDVYTDVKISSKKLSFKTVNEEGKTESESYTRVK